MDDLTNDDPLAVPHDDPIEDDEDVVAPVSKFEDPNLESLDDLADEEEEEEGLDLDEEEDSF